MLMKKFIIWTKWKTKVRWRQLWGNLRLFNVSLERRAWVFLLLGRMIGIVAMFILGGAISYACWHFHVPREGAWSVVLLFPLIDGYSDGRGFKGFMSSANEERWLFKVDPFVKTRFLGASLSGHLAVKESWNTAA